MRIAYISYEYPPDTAFGGIGTYVYQVAKMMCQRGHEIEVFCASLNRTITEVNEGITVHRVECTNRGVFNNKVLSCFESSNEKKRFDIIESPEYFADGLAIKIKFPDIPLIVKLHTPGFLIKQVNYTYFGIFNKAKYILSGLVRGKLYKPFWKSPVVETDPEYLITKLADQIHTPSLALADIVSNKWNIKRSQILHVPYPYIPCSDLLTIPINTGTNRITYVGRLEIRKGLVELSKAIVIVLKMRPSVKFRFVGSVQDSPVYGVDMKTYLLQKLKNNHKSLEFCEVSSESIPGVYADTDICVFPSIWENFPNTCLEAMSAGRGIVASKNGGMADMLKDSPGGLLIDPINCNDIADSLIRLLDDKILRQELGKNARNKVLTNYNETTIGALMEKQYQSSLAKFQ